jgi:hypothetical protein
MNSNKRPIAVWITALVAIAFGTLTIKSGGAVLLFDGAARQAAGDYVPFVLWFNFIAGFFYLIAGVGLWQRRRWAVALASAIAAATLAVFAALGLHILNQGAYEMRTVIAMALRCGVWSAIALTAWWQWRTGGNGQPLHHRPSSE